MTDDIVTRLLALNHPDASDAADEIERLRQLIDALAEALTDARRRHPCDCADRYDDRTGAAAINKWNEARRG